MLNPALFLVFLAVAVPTIMTPGPGVLMSISNCLRLGLRKATPGIIGVALGTLVIALLSATGLGVLLASSHTAYNIVKATGILFMFYLGWKRWKAPASPIGSACLAKSASDVSAASSPMQLFGEGILLQLTNPQLIIFYVTLFPQCIDPALPYATQLLLLSGLYTVLVWLIHSLYGWLALQASERFMTAGASRLINRTAAVAFWLIAVWLLSSIAAELLA